MLGVTIGSMMSHWMTEMMVELVCEKRKLANASFTEIQFWTETSEGFLVDLENSNGADLQDLRVW